jgi:hypothetical protein
VANAPINPASHLFIANGTGPSANQDACTSVQVAATLVLAAILVTRTKAALKLIPIAMGSVARSLKCERAQ